MDELFARFAARYGRAWTTQCGTTDRAMALTHAEWAETLAGLTRAQVQHGLVIDAKRGDQWPPSSPQFRAMCLDVPSFPALRYECQHPEVPRTPFGVLCWQFIDAYTLARADRQGADRILRDAYELARAHVLDGGKLPVVHEALAKPDVPERTPASPETARRHVDEILRKLDVDDQAEGSEPA